MVHEDEVAVPAETPNIPGTNEKARGSNTRQSTPRPINEETQLEAEEHLPNVECPCGVDQDDGMMILCAACGNWQHGACFAILKPEDAPETHICVTCAEDPNTTDFDGCTDPSLVNLNENELRATCLWRRALIAVSETSRILGTSLSKRLAVDVNIGNHLVKRLEKEGFVKSTSKGKRLGKLVQKDKVNTEGMEKYFKRVEDSDDDDEDVLIHRPDVTEDAQPDDNLDAIVDQASRLELQDKRLAGNDKVKSDLDIQKRQGKKRAVSLLDREVEFEINDSQDLPENEGEPPRKKTSLATKPLLV